MRNRSFGIASIDCPTWIRRRWHAALHDNDPFIIGLFVNFMHRASSGELFWR
jgi:hypothetical protein